MLNNVVLFYLSANKALTEKVAKILNIKIGKVELENFADGEIMARTLSNVSDKKCYIIQSTAKPATEHIFELLIFIDSLKQNNAKEIIVIMPYYGYARQDRVARKGEPISAKMVAKLYQAVGVDRIITVDLHTSQIQGFFSCPVYEITPTDLFADYLTKLFKENHVNYQDLVIVSPDHGSALRARDLCSMFEGASLAVIDKRRPAPNKSEVTNLVGDVKGKTCVIIDDIIDTCMTINNAAEKLLQCGANDIYVIATHAVLSSNTFIKEIKKIIVTDTVEKDLDNIVVLSVAPLIAEVIKNDN